MKCLIESKAGVLNPNTPFWGKTKMGVNGLKYQWCRFLSDHEGGTKSKVEETGEIFYPAFDDIVLIEEYCPVS